MSANLAELIEGIASLQVYNSVYAVPPELVAKIVDELEHDRASLKACSFVATPFRGPSQRHLLRSIWIHRENWKYYSNWQKGLHKGTTVPSGTIKSFSSLLSESPYLAGYIRDLTIDLPDSADEDIPLAGVLQTAPNLERFVISGLSTRWTDLSPALASTILDVFTRPSLSILHLLDIKGIPESEVMRALSAMNIFSLHTTTFEPEPHTDSIHRPMSNAKHLLLGTNHPSTYEAILSRRAPKLGNVKRLFLTLNGNRHFDEVLMSVANSLTCLELDCGRLNTSFQLPTLPHLCTLILHISQDLTRRIPEGLARTLRGLQLVSLTMIFAIQNRIVEEPWADEGPLIGLDERLIEETHCKLLFLDPTTRPSVRDSAYASFCQALRAALPGFSMQFSRIENEHSYISRLP
ncbi:hypothetical protein R3P38DRAFT_2600670 [Favolaschia claudopus]|uniref:F-box domain-containing protein n=1 Tax=Favolaschia claudopus TaxID=2862362 RepID=A0AAW0DVG1_9AGAR